MLRCCRVVVVAAWNLGLRSVEQGTSAYGITGCHVTFYIETSVVVAEVISQNLPTPLFLSLSFLVATQRTLRPKYNSYAFCLQLKTLLAPLPLQGTRFSYHSKTSRNSSPFVKRKLIRN